MPLADLLSWTRLALVIPIAVAALDGSPRVFVGLVLLAFTTDACDGPIARWQRTASARGAQLDSRADAAIYLTVPFLALRVFPELSGELAGLTVATLVACVIPPVIGTLKFGRLPALHLWSSRAASVMMAAGLGALAFASDARLLWLGCGILVASALEELAGILLLPRWTPDLPTLYHVLVARNTSYPTPRSLRS